VTDSRFSKRYGHRSNESDIKIRDNAPKGISESLLAIAVQAARQNLKGVEFFIAEIEIHEALSDLSIRPKPDLTGVQSSMQ